MLEQLQNASSSSCCGATDGLKRMPAWQGLTLASALPEVAPAEAAPEPHAPQGEYATGANIDQVPFSVSLDQNATPNDVELLSPAGGLDAAYAAFHYGADAVYLGLKKFSARAEAENFTLDDLDEITSFAHAQERQRRVFVTINTLILQNELSELIEALGAASEIGVDALIVQDLGTFRLVRKYFPEIELHASTQLAVHNRAGAEALKALGFKRVVLARELTLEEVADITAASGIETEVFIHGALCYSYSGLCLFSSQSNGRSGNRGKCAYSCRDEFQVSGAPDTLRDGTPTIRSANHGFAFSMKDLALPDHLPALRAAGVSCVKIEGRKKSPLYSATTTDYYRRLLDGKLGADERSRHEADMQTVFSRPWTRLFTLSHKHKEVADRDTVGHRGTPIGVVEKVSGAGSEQALLHFTTARALERHDGLQIDIPGLGKPFGFAVETMRLAGVRAHGDMFEAPQGSALEVMMPEEHPPIPEGAKIYCSSSQDVKRRYRFNRAKPGQFRARRKVCVELNLNAGALIARAEIQSRRVGEKSIVVERSLTGKFELAKDAAKMLAAARGAFEKLGETRLELEAFDFKNPQLLFVPVSQLNALRREITDALESQLDVALKARLDLVRGEALPSMKFNFSKGAEETSNKGGRKPPLPGGPVWSVKVDRISFLDNFEAQDFENLDEVVIDIARDHATLLLEKIERLATRIGKEKIRLALPAVTRKWEEQGVLLKLARLRGAGFEKWEAANVSAWSYLGALGLLRGEKDSAIELAADWSVYVVNRQAALQVLEMGAQRFALSTEDGIENMRSLLREFGPRAVLIAHQDTPMFMAESCAYANLIGGCPGKANCRFESMDMVSTHGEKVQAIDYHCRTIVLNKGAFCIAPRLSELIAAGAQSLRADFIYRNYSPDEAVRAWRLVRAGKNVAHGHAANFDRGML